MDVAGASAHALIDQVIDQLDDGVITHQQAQLFCVNVGSIDFGFQQPLDDAFDARGAALQAGQGLGNRYRGRENDFYRHAGDFLDLVDCEQLERVLECDGQDAVFLGDHDSVVPNGQVEWQAMPQLVVQAVVRKRMEGQTEQLSPQAIGAVEGDRALGNESFDRSGLAAGALLEGCLKNSSVVDVRNF